MYFRQELTTALLEPAEGENDRRNYFMINLHANMWPGRVSDQRPLDSQSDSIPNTNTEYRIETKDTVRKTPTLF